MRDRIGEAEIRISTQEDTMAPISEKVAMCEKQILMYQQKVDDLENCMRRKIIQIVGLPERVQGQDPGGFVEKWLR